MAGVPGAAAAQLASAAEGEEHGDHDGGDNAGQR
jgi:hypothetical protein